MGETVITMTQKELNNRIAMSLLQQCAWMWEHCTRNPNEDEFKLTDVVQGLTARNRTNTKPGWTMVEMTLCERWEHFADGIDGLKCFDRETGEVTLWVEDFHCSYLLMDIFGIAKAFCQGNACQSLMNNTVFGYTDGEHWTKLPSATKPTKKAEKKNEAKVVVKQIAQPTQTKGVTAPRKVKNEELRMKNGAETIKLSAISALSAGQKSLADRLREALRARLAQAA